MHPSDLDLEARDDVAYGSFAVRLRAWIIDVAIVAGIFLTVLLGSDAIPNAEYSGRVALFIVVAFVLLYEPVLVARFGGTVGHRVNNLRVVADKSGANPSFGRAFARFSIKTILGLYSFIAMALTRRHQAVHDSLTSTTVQIRDLSRARPGDIEVARALMAEGPMPSKWRRLAIIVAYSAAVFVVVSVLGASTVSLDCLDRDACTSQENLLLDATGLVWIAASIYFIIAGWRGRLWGARSKRSGTTVPERLHNP